MGLFKKRQQTNEELAAMRAEMQSLREHLAQTDAVNDRLAERLGHLDAENERLNQHVGTVEARVGEVATQVGSVEHEVVTVAGSIGPTVDQAIRSVAETSPSADDVEGLRSELRNVEALAKQSSASVDAPLAEVRGQLEELAEALRLQRAQIADVALVATDAAERSEQTDSKVAGLAASEQRESSAEETPPDTDEAQRQLGQLAEKVASLDSRVNQVSLELTNQLTELSSDIDRAGESGDTSALIDRINAQLDDITSGQERLANEQARYAIQFRSDLAELANRLKR